MVGQWKGRFPSPLPLEFYSSSNFIGLFVEEKVAEVIKSFAADFATEAASKAGVSVCVFVIATDDDTVENNLDFLSLLLPFFLIQFNFNYSVLF